MGDREEPTLKDRPHLDTPTVDIGGRPKIADSRPESAPTSAFDPPRDRFETRAELGRGGMGRVDEAYDRALGRDVAIKHMLSHTEVDLARFEREARITARLEHPGIVPIHDAGRSADGTPYYVMRRVDGRPLSELIDGKPLSERLRLVPNVLAACDAAGFAHARGIVHRDIKPTNILVGPFGETLLIDWGLAREMESRDVATPASMPSDPQLTRAGTVAGTPGFMAPEQARGEAVDARADVFALGATLFYVLAGTLPWHGGSTEMIDHVGAGRPPDWRLLPSEVPADLRAIVEKAMAPNLVDRYADAGALAADLRRFTLGNLVAAYEYGLFGKLWRFARKHRAAVLVGLVSLVVVVTTAVISIRRVVAERDNANTARKLAETRQREARAAADRLLVAHARELVETSPIEAIAALRTLPPDSPSWPEAWAVATTAYYRGIPIGFLGTAEPTMVGIAGDNRHAYAVSLNHGQLVLIDLDGKTKRVLGNFGRVFGAAWLDPTHIVLGLETETIVLDIMTDAKRSLSVARSMISSNRDGRAMLLAERTLYELAGADAAPAKIADGIDFYQGSRDLTAAVIHRGQQRELWTGDKKIALPPLPAGRTVWSVAYVIQPDLLAELTYDAAIMYDVVDGTLVERGQWPVTRGVLSIGVTKKRGYVFDALGYQRLDDSGARTNERFAGIYQEGDSIVLTLTDGTIWILDARGLLKVGKMHAHYSRLDLSNDGNHLIASTDSGEILAWDLSKIRPRVYHVGRAYTPLALTDHALWLSEAGTGVSRLDLVTGKLAVEVPFFSLFSRFRVAKDESWAAIIDEGSKTLLLAARGKPVVHEDDVHVIAATAHELMYVTSDHKLARWDGEHASVIVDLPSQPNLISAGTAVCFVGYDSKELARVDLATKRIDRTRLPGLVDWMWVDKHNTAWILADGATLRWDASSSMPVKLDIQDAPDDVNGTDNYVALHSSRSIQTIGPKGERRIIPYASTGAVAMANDLIAAVSADGEIAIIDPASGAIANLSTPHDAAVPIVVGEHELAIIDHDFGADDLLVQIVDVEVPRDPVALRHWLATITNAKPLPNSEAVVWP